MLLKDNYSDVFYTRGRFEGGNLFYIIYKDKYT